jgi:hypothetical protein
VLVFVSSLVQIELNLISCNSSLVVQGGFFMATNSKEVQKKADAKRAGKKARAWTAVIYPESANENWLEILGESLVQCLVSPLHDRDVEPTGELKKEHYHVVISFTNPATFEKAKAVFDSIGAVVPPENQSRVKDYRQMARYLCHLDQPNKHRYSTDDVVAFGGVDYKALVMTGADEDELLDEIEDYILANRIVSFTSFQRICRDLHPEWKYVLRHKYSYYIRETIKANYWAILNEEFISTCEEAK